MSARAFLLRWPGSLWPARTRSPRPIRCPVLGCPALAGLAALCLALGGSPEFTLAHGPSSAGPAGTDHQPSARVTELEGTLEVLHEDWPDGARHRYFLRSNSGRYSLDLADRQTH